MLNQQYVTLHFHTEPTHGQGLVEVMANSLGHLNVYNHLHVNDTQAGEATTAGQLREDMDDDSLLAGYPTSLPIIWFAFPSSLGLHCAMAKLEDIIAYSAATLDEYVPEDVGGYWVARNHVGGTQCDHQHQDEAQAAQCCISLNEEA